MLYVFGRIYEYGLYIMHDLSLILGCMRSVICFLFLNKLVFLEKMLMKMFYIVLNCEGLLWELVTLCLPIPLVPVMYPWV